MKNFVRLAGISLLILSAAVGPWVVFAAVKTFNSPCTSNWSDATCWNTSSAPTTNDDVILDSAATNSSNDDLNSAIQLHSVTIDSSGQMAVSGGPVVLQSGGAITDNNSGTLASIWTAGITLNGPATITEAGGEGLTLNGAISGIGGLTLSNSSTIADSLVLGAVNSYSGTTTVVGGAPSEILANVNGAIPIGSALTINGGGSLKFGESSTIGSLAGNGNVALGATTLTAGGNNTSTTYQGVLSGTGGLIKVGTGTLLLAGLNTYSGGTLVSAGALKGPASSFPGDITDNGTVIFSQGGSGTYNGVISGSGGMSVAAGTITLSNANTYAGPTSVLAGATLTVNGSTAAGNTITVNSGATLNGSGTINGAIVLIGSATLGNSLIVNGAVTLATSTAVAVSPSTAVSGTAQTFTATVTHSSAVTSGTVTFIDTTTNTTLDTNVPVNGSGQASTAATLALGGHSIQATYNPDASHGSSSGNASALVIAQANEGGLLYSVNSSDNSVSLYTTNGDGTLTSAGAAIAVGRNPLYLTVRRDQAFAYVSNDEDASISVIDTATQTVGQTVTVSAASSTLGVVTGPDGSTLYVAARAPLTNTIRILSANVNTGQLTETGMINVGSSPRGLAISQDGTRLYVANQGNGISNGSVSVIDTGTNSVIATIPVGLGPTDIAVNPANSRVYVSNFNSNTVSVIDTATNTVVATKATSSSPFGVSVSLDGNYYFVSNRSDGTISEFSAATDTIVGSAIAAGSFPEGQAITPDGTFLYVANAGAPSNTVGMYAFDPVTGLVAANSPATIPAGSAPVELAICGNGNTMLAAGAMFKANSAGAISCAGPAPAFTGGTLLINGTGFTIPQSFTLGASGGTIDTNGNAATFNGVFTGVGALTKAGAGTLTLSAANTYTGATTVSAGTLTVNGSLAAGSAVTVGSGATLNGNGTINGNVTLSAGSTVDLSSGLTVHGTTTNNGGILTLPATSTTISPLVATVTYGVSQTFTATVTFGSNPVTGGSVTFVDSATSATLANNVALNSSGQASAAAVLAAGSHTIKATYNPDAVHNGSSASTVSNTVNKASLTVNADNQIITYGGTPAFTTTVSGFVNGDTSAVVTGAASFSTNATTTNGKANAGLWTITPTAGSLSASNNNYTFATFTPGTLTVNRAVLTVTANNVTRQAGTANPSFSATITGFVNGDTAAAVSGSAMLTTSATSMSPLGTYVITSSLGSLAAPNYSFTFVNGTLTVSAQNPAPTVTSVAPAVVVTAASSINIAVHGANFIPISVVQVNGSPRPTIFNSGSQLTATLNAGDLAAPGILTITVMTQAPGGGAASALLTVLNSAFATTVSVPPGISSIQASGTSTLITGAATLIPSLGNSPTPAFARWSYSNNGVVVSEASEPAKPGLSAGMFYALVGGNVNTGAAFANPSPAAATVSFSFTDLNGRAAGSGSFTIPGGGQVGKFLSESPFNLGANAEGTISFSSSSPVGVVALRGVTNARGDFLISTLPIVDLSAPVQTGIVTVPQFADGGGWSTILLLMNSTSTTITGSVQFLDKTTGQPETMTINGSSASSFSYSIPAGGSQRLTTAGTASAISTGSIRMTPAGTSAAPSVQAVFSLQVGAMTVSESGIAGMPATASVQTYVESTGNFPAAAPGSAQSGIAIANIGAATEIINLDFTILNGASSTRHTTLSLAGQSQVSLFLSQIPGFTDLTSPIEGILHIYTADGSQNLAITVLRGRYNETGDFLTSAVPALPNPSYPADTPLIIPDFAVGGGYTTTFVFMNPSLIGTTILLQTNTPSGQPLKLPFN